MPHDAGKLGRVGPQAAALGMILTETQLDQLAELASELRGWAAKANLTAISDPADVEIKHVIDSLTLVPTLRRVLGGQGSVIDVGSGAGFPGLVVAIAMPEVHVTLLEATGRKIAFLDHVLQKLHLVNARTAHARAEDLARVAGHRERYDVAVARAVGSIPTLVELLVPFVKLGGSALLMKTAKGAQNELEAAQYAVQTMGSIVEDVMTVSLPDLLNDRVLVVIRKVSPTEASFPRRPGVPQRRPL